MSIVCVVRHANARLTGSEYARVVFWNRTNPAEHWTRAHAYVAISRAKERCWIVGTQRELERVCSQVEHKRRTVFSLLLRSTEMANDVLPYEPAPVVPLDELVLDDNKAVPCVEVLEPPQAKK